MPSRRCITYRNFLGLLIASMAVWGCEHAPPFEPGAVVESKLSSIQENIFDKKCAIPTCHSGAGAPLGLDLDAGQSHGNLVGVQAIQSSLDRVEPGDPDNSFLIRKLEGTLGGGEGQQMPRNADPLSVKEIQAIRDWITNGALDD